MSNIRACTGDLPPAINGTSEPLIAPDAITAVGPASVRVTDSADLTQ
jgi:hypothetical protein